MYHSVPTFTLQEKSHRTNKFIYIIEMYTLGEKICLALMGKYCVLEVETIFVVFEKYRYIIHVYSFESTII